VRDQRGMNRCPSSEQSREYARIAWMLPANGWQGRSKRDVDRLLTMRSDRQPVATHGNGFGLLKRF
jgi:hypothetical protein